MGFAVLCARLHSNGRLTTKSALLDAVWEHQFVSESVLWTTISELCRALGDDARQRRLIETAARRGYRFIGRAHAAEPVPAGSTRRVAAVTEDGVAPGGVSIAGRHAALD